MFLCLCERKIKKKKENDFFLSEVEVKNEGGKKILLSVFFSCLDLRVVLFSPACLLLSLQTN